MMKPMDVSLILEKENQILHDSLCMEVLLFLEQKEMLTISELKSLMQQPLEKFEDKIKWLNEGKYIQQNPFADETKLFDTRKYALGIKGVFLLSKIRAQFPECF
jgi:hypothetical protein